MTGEGVMQREIIICATKRDGTIVPPRTKKNHAQIIPGVMRTLKDGRRIQAPLLAASPEYKEWERAAIHSLKPWVLAMHREGAIPLPKEPMNCRALIYRHANVGDAVGFYQGLADFLEHNYGTDEEPIRILHNDCYIVSWDGSRLLKDKDRPRIELVLEPVGYTISTLMAQRELEMFNV